MKKGIKDKKAKIKILVAVIIVLTAIWLIVAVLKPNNLKGTKTVDISQGLSTIEIADTLKNEDVISSKLIFLLKVNMSEYKGRLKYGTFEFSPKDSYGDIIKKIATGGAKKETVTITIPEGFSAEKIIALLAEKGFGTKDEIKKALDDDYDYDFLKKINPPGECRYKLQGFLFPSTYEFYTDTTPHDIFDRMLGEFEKQFNSLNISCDNLFEVITKASLIEREAKTDNDRAKIAGVIENRLKEGMKLQIDATVVYAISDGMYDTARVLYKDLEVDSPYNTYKNYGLPIGPIASPGIKSIEAALKPEVHDYLYYRTDTAKNDGSHVFSRDFEEHKTAND